MRLNLLIAAASVASALIVAGCVHDPLTDPTAEEPEPTVPGCTPSNDVCFESSVLPIFVSRCAKSGCHDAATHEEGYVLTTYAKITSKGIDPGDARNSKLYEVLFEDGDDRMPPDAPLSQAEKDSIKVWINQGAKNTVDCNCFCDENQYTYTAIIRPLLNANCVGCHKPGSLGGNIDLSTYAAVKAQADNGKLIGSTKQLPGYTPMPQNGKLSDCQLAQLQNWVDDGALNN